MTILHHKQNGFTLMELMVSVALMLILIGAVVMVFTNSSEVFSMSEAKMNVFQNARSAMELIARELGGMTNKATDKLRISAPLTTGTILTFSATTFRMNGTTRENGLCKVEYILESTSLPELNNLVRRVSWTDSSSVSHENKNLLAQFIVQGTVKVGIFYYDVSDTTTYDDDNDSADADGTANDGVGWKYLELPDHPGSLTNPHTFTESDAKKIFLQVPPAIRLTMDVTDQNRKSTRTISRTIWIASSSQ